MWPVSGVFFFFLNYPSKSLLMRASQRMYQLCGFVRWAAITRNGSERECTVCAPALLSLALGVSSTLLFLLPCSKVEKWHMNSRLLLAWWVRACVCMCARVRLSQPGRGDEVCWNIWHDSSFCAPTAPKWQWHQQQQKQRQHRLQGSASYCSSQIAALFCQDEHFSCPDPIGMH